MPLTTKTEESLYFGTKRVYLGQVPGKTFLFRPEEWELSTNIDSPPEEKEDDRPVDDETSTPPIVLPEVPAVDFVKRLDINATDDDCDDDISCLPAFLQQPSIKQQPQETLSSSSQHCYRAVSSGVRSALVRLEEEDDIDGGGCCWYRLKGCGNHDQGFVVRENVNPTSDRIWKDIRGSAFPSTTFRELNVAHRLQQQQGKSLGIPSANTPVAWFRYDGNHELPLGKRYQTTCIVEKTLGDRRLGTHLLAGLSLLLPSLLDESRIDLDALIQQFPSFRIPDKENLDSMIETSDFFTDFAMATAGNGGPPEEGSSSTPSGYGIMWPHLQRDATSLANILNYPLPIHPPKTMPTQWTNQGKRCKTDDEWLENFYKEILEDFNDALQQQPQSTTSSLISSENVLSYLYYQLGFESGTFLSNLHELGYSWGTYQDKMCRKEWDEWHCNAHTNNLVVLPESHHKGFLSYLDLDMAFDGSTYKDPITKRIGLSPAELRALQWREQVNFMEVLAGGDASSGLPQVAMGTVRDTETTKQKLVQTALTDTMLVGYLDAYHKQDSRVLGTTSPELYHASHALIRLAIFVMMDYIA